MMQLNGQRSLALLTIMPALLLVELGIGWAIFSNVKRTGVIDSNINKLDLYLLTNTKYISSGEAAQRGYLLTADEKFYDTYVTDIREWVKNEKYYYQLPPEAKRPEVDEIQRISRQKIDDLEMAISLYNGGRKDSALAVVKAGHSKSLTDSIRSKSTRLRVEIGDVILTERKREYGLIYAFFAVILILILFSLILAWITYIAFRDYTKSLEITVKSLEEANEQLTKYNYDSYHSLKTPLRNINGFLQLLEKKFNPQFDAEAKEYMHFITESVRQLSAIIDDMRHKYLEQKDDVEPKQ